MASERVLAEVGEETDEEPLAASAPTGEERLDEELGAVAPLSEEAPAVFAVVRREHGEDPALAPRNFAREGLYSYTSLSGAHPHSDEPAVEADEGVVLLHEGRSGLGSETSNESDGSNESESSLVDDASGSRESGGSPACVLGAQESATALGTAFHRLAQRAIERSEWGSLFAPSEAAVRAQIQKEGLSEEQQARLRAALVRWLGSDEAALFAAFENRRAEVPFTVAIGDFFLEGEIDGLADNGMGPPSSSTTRPAAAPTRRPSSLTRSTVSRRAATPMRSCAPATSRWTPISCASSTRPPTTRTIRRSFRIISKKPIWPLWKRL